jgi:hypothetical protein
MRKKEKEEEAISEQNAASRWQTGYCSEKAIIHSCCRAFPLSFQNGFSYFGATIFHFEFFILH